MIESGDAEKCSTMGLEDRGGKQYYYRKRREGKRVISEYVGGGEFGRLCSVLDEEDRLEREVDRAEWKKETEHEREINREIDDLGDMIRTLTKAVLVANGYHTHKGQWRKKRDDPSS